MKELIPKKTDKTVCRQKPPNQWLYVIEKENGNVKIGVSTVPKERILVLERSGGFSVKNKLLLGPYQNGYEVEHELHKMFAKHRVVSEWFDISFYEAAIMARRIGETIGNSAVVAVYEKNTEQLFDWLFFLMQKRIAELEDAYRKYGFSIVWDNDGTFWLESNEYGLIRPWFFKELMDFKIEEAR